MLTSKFPLRLVSSEFQYLAGSPQPDTTPARLWLTSLQLALCGAVYFPGASAECVMEYVEKVRRDSP